jgi:hypothetical protein
MSLGKLPENPEIKVIETPYAALDIGGRQIPLFERNSGAQSLPAPNECFAVRITPDHQLDSYRRLAPAGEARNFLKKPGRYIVLAGKKIAAELIDPHQSLPNAELLLLTGNLGNWNIRGIK